MKNFTKSIPFWAGLTTSVFLSLAISFVDYKIKFDGLCMDCDNDFGLPFKIYQSGSIMHTTQILWLGLLCNLIIFGLLSFGLGFITQFLWNKYRTKALK